MTTATIELEADRDSLSTAELDLKVLLRREVIPAFFIDVGWVAWKRRYTTQALVPGDQEFTLPADFAHMKNVFLHPDYDRKSALAYIGEDTEKVLKAESNTTRSKPSGYYFMLVPGGGAGQWFRRLRFNAPSDASYTCRYEYDITPNFTDDITSVDLDQYVPPKYQWALVERLRRELVARRYGIGDDRYQMQDTKYQEWLGRIASEPELTRQQRAIFVR